MKRHIVIQDDGTEIGIFHNLKGDNHMYDWICSSDDGAYEDKSKYIFTTKEDAYYDMRDAALEKMKWNTVYNEDFEDDEHQIDYHVVFSKDKIVHESYSGVYTYEIRKIMTSREAIEKNNVVIFEADDVNDSTWDVIISILKEHIPGFSVVYGDGNRMAFAIPKK